MKKTITIIMAVVIAFALSVSCFAAVYGDVNKDGKINSGDALEILMVSAGIKTLTAEQKTLADVTGDNQINSSDALSVLMRSVNLIDIFPVEQGEEPDIDHGFIG